MKAKLSHLYFPGHLTHSQKAASVENVLPREELLQIAGRGRGSGGPDSKSLGALKHSQLE